MKIVYSHFHSSLSNGISELVTRKQYGTIYIGTKSLQKGEINEYDWQKLVFKYMFLLLPIMIEFLGLLFQTDIPDVLVYNSND